MEPKPWVWPMRRQPGGGALARRGEGTFDSPSQSVPHAESPGLMRSGTWPAVTYLRSITEMETARLAGILRGERSEA